LGEGCARRACARACVDFALAPTAAEAAAAEAASRHGALDQRQRAVPRARLREGCHRAHAILHRARRRAKVRARRLLDRRARLHPILYGARRRQALHVRGMQVGLETKRLSGPSWVTSSIEVLRSSSNGDPLHMEKGWRGNFSSAVLLVHVLSWGPCLTRTVIYGRKGTSMSCTPYRTKARTLAYAKRASRLQGGVFYLRTTRANAHDRHVPSEYHPLNYLLHSVSPKH